MALLLAAPLASAGSLKMTVAARVLPFVRMHVDAGRTVLVTRTEAGAVATQAGATVDVTSNTGGYSLQLDVVDPDVVDVVVEGLGAPLRFGAMGAMAHLRLPLGGARHDMRVLSYRVRYAANAMEGLRPAPLRISVQAS